MYLFICVLLPFACHKRNLVFKFFAFVLRLWKPPQIVASCFMYIAIVMLLLLLLFFLHFHFYFSCLAHGTREWASEWECVICCVLADDWWKTIPSNVDIYCGSDNAIINIQTAIKLSGIKSHVNSLLIIYPKPSLFSLCVWITSSIYLSDRMALATTFRMNEITLTSRFSILYTSGDCTILKTGPNMYQLCAVKPYCFLNWITFFHMWYHIITFVEQSLPISIER